MSKSNLRVVLAMDPGDFAALTARDSRPERHCQAMTIAEPNVEQATTMLTSGLDRLEAEYPCESPRTPQRRRSASPTAMSPTRSSL